MERFVISHFSQSNPSGPGQDDIPALLRRVASSIEELGAVSVQDLVLHAGLVDAEEWPLITVYYTDGTAGPVSNSSAVAADSEC